MQSNLFQVSVSSEIGLRRIRLVSGAVIFIWLFATLSHEMCCCDLRITLMCTKSILNNHRLREHLGNLSSWQCQMASESQISPYTHTKLFNCVLTNFFSPLTEELLPHASHSMTADPLSNYFITSFVSQLCGICSSSRFMKIKRLFSMWKSMFLVTSLLMEIFISLESNGKLMKNLDEIVQ